MGRFGSGRVGAGSVVLLAVVAACSGSNDGDVLGGVGAGDGDLDELVEVLPEDAPALASVDAAAIREELGLPDDQGMGDLSDETTAPFGYAMAAALPFLADPRETPIREALDTGAMTAAASVPVIGPEHSVAVVRTSQPFDDLAEALVNQDEGYERDGNLVATDQPSIRVGSVTAVTTAAGADDVIVLAQSTEVANAVAAGEGDGPTLAAALASVDGPLRAAFATTVDSDSCLETLAAGAQSDPAEGEIALTVADPADADGVDLLPGDSRLARDLDLDPPEVEGRTVTVRYRYDGIRSPIDFLFSDMVLGDLFRCP